MRFGGGLIIGLVLGFGGYLGYQQVTSHQDPCLGHCGTGTSCVEGVCIREEALADSGKRRRKRRRRRGHRRRRGTTGAQEPEWRTPTASDLRPKVRGPSLKGTDYVNLEDKGGGERELSSDDVDARFRRQDRKIIACIDRAREGWDISQGKVVVAFRIERSGKVDKVRVRAPAVLQRQGIYDCIRPLVVGLRFPRSSRSLVMSYPYALD